MKKSDKNWLSPYILKYKNRNLLELGCGILDDTLVLCEDANHVTAIDQTILANLAKDNVTILQLDMVKVWPFKPAEFDIIVASLCLHYFTWNVSKQIIVKIKHVLKSNGCLIGRVNSTKDVNFGAVGHRQVENGLFQVNEQQKRFFDISMLKELFGNNWTFDSISEREIDRYKSPKHIIEFVARPN